MTSGLFALAGVLLGFGLSMLRDWYRDKKQVESLARVLALEVYLETITAKKSVASGAEVKQKFLAGESRSRAEYLEKDSPSPYKANLDKVAKLPSDIVLWLATFHDIVASFHAKSKLLGDSFRDFYSQRPVASREDILKHLEEYEKQGTNVVALGTQILRRVDQRFPPKEDARTWLIEAEKPGQARLLWREEKND